MKNNKATTRLKCEVEYCIYNVNYFCTAKSVGIDSSGLCDSHIVVDIPKEQLEVMKKKQLKLWKQRTKNPYN